jgi:hypothetical protein
VPGAGEQPDREILGDSATHAKAVQEHPGGSNSDPDPRPTRTGATDGGHVSAPAAAQPASDHPAAGDGNDAPPGGGAISTLYALGLGDHIFPIAPGSKKPAKEGWQTSPPMSEAEARAWLDRSGNIGLRTGVKSGVVVIDDDQPKHGGGPYTPPQTGLVAASPTGSRHYYYRAPHPCLRNSESKLAEHVDVRGDGGYVVAPGSRHPGGGRYEWVATGEPADLPPEVVARLSPRRRNRELRGATISAVGARGSRRAQAALKNERAALAQTPEGARNSKLYQSAFNLGQLVATGELDSAEVEGALTDAANTAGLGEAETNRTLHSGLEAGMKHPRQDPPRVGEASRPGDLPSAPARSESPAPAVGRREVLVPGAHRLPPKGDYTEQGTGSFASQALAVLPEEAFYRRGNGIVEVLEGSCNGVEPDRLRAVVDAHARLCQGVQGIREGDRPRIRAVPSAVHPLQPGPRRTDSG